MVFRLKKLSSIRNTIFLLIYIQFSLINRLYAFSEAKQIFPTTSISQSCYGYQTFNLFSSLLPSAVVLVTAEITESAESYPVTRLDSSEPTCYYIQIFFITSTPSESRASFLRSVEFSLLLIRIVIFVFPLPKVVTIEPFPDLMFFVVTPLMRYLAHWMNTKK